MFRCTRCANPTDKMSGRCDECLCSPEGQAETKARQDKIRTEHQEKMTVEEAALWVKRWSGTTHPAYLQELAEAKEVLRSRGNVPETSSWEGGVYSGSVRPQQGAPGGTYE